MIYEKLPIVFLSTLATEKNDSINSQIATYILNHLEELKNIGITQMAKECNVAISSISRFCKDIGLEDYAELKELLLSTNFYFQQNSKDMSASERLNQYTLKVVSSINMVSSSIDMNSIIRLCNDLKQYQKVSVFGLFKAAFAALSLQGDLLMLGKKVYTHMSYTQQIEYIKQTSQDDLLIIFSYTGSYFDYPNLRRLKQRLKNPKIWVVASQKNEELDFVDDWIIFDSLQDQNSHPYQLQFIAGLIAQEYSNMI